MLPCKKCCKQQKSYHVSFFILEARSSVKLESQFMDGTEYDDEVEDNNDHDTSLSFEEPVDFEERQMVVLEKLVQKFLFKILNFV